MCFARMAIGADRLAPHRSPREQQMTMKIQDIMSVEPNTVTPDTPITEAAPFRSNLRG
jgi:CBS domain-containing protein